MQGLITGAAFYESEHLVVLCGYSTLLQPFIYLLYDYPENHFFCGNKRKININLFGNQIEAIAGATPVDFYMTNEKFTIGNTSIPASLHHANLGNYLSNYLFGTPPTSIENYDFPPSDGNIKVYPNPGYYFSNKSVNSSSISSPISKAIKNLSLSIFKWDKISR